VDFDAFTGQDAWENVEVSAITRLHASARQMPGLIVRETGLSGASGSGDLYMYRLNQSNNLAELYRSNNGAFQRLAYEAVLGSQIPDHTDIFLKMFVETMDEGGVLLRGLASLDPSFSEIFGRIDYLDTDPNRILGPGSAGFRLYGGSVGNFDNFTVETFQIPEPATLALLGLGALGLLRRRRKA